MAKIQKPTAQQRKLARANRDPLSFVSAEDKRRYSGLKIAVLVEGQPDLLGKVIASGENHQSVRTQVSSSQFAGKKWALCEVPRPTS